MSKPKQLEPETPPKPKKKRGLLLVLIGVIVLAGAGGGGFFWWKTQQAKAATTEADGEQPGSEEEAVVAGALSFAPFVVNLADPSGTHYLKADVRLIISGPESVEDLNEDEVTMLRLRSAILEHLSERKADELVTSDGKEALKAAITQRSSTILTDAKVVDVLFNEFVVQY